MNFFFLFKQKTAYEMRISDWSSDVCSSDLGDDRRAIALAARAAEGNGEWAAMAHWVAGLAAFRSDDCTCAAGHFARFPTAAHSQEPAPAAESSTRAADTAAGRADGVTARLRAAPRIHGAFPGPLARR